MDIGHLVHPEWMPILEDPTIKNTLETSWAWAKERQTHVCVLPKEENWLKALSFCGPSDIKVVILGQDPYPNAKDAMGLSFSVDRSTKPLPGSLRNIRKELSRHYTPMPDHGDLTGWAKQGVLLLNTVLTVDEGDAASHSKKAQWEHFTHHILKALAKEKKPMVVLAWGKHAHKAAQFFTYPRKVIKTSHPSGLAHYRAGNDFSAFSGSDCFLNTNLFLLQHGRQAVDWTNLD